MTNQRMTNEEFDALWQRARTEGRARRMTADYIIWRKRRQRNAVMTVAIAVVAIGISLPLLLGRGSKAYDRVYCNRTGTSDAEWLTVADEMLVEMAI